MNMSNEETRLRAVKLRIPRLTQELRDDMSVGEGSMDWQAELNQQVAQALDAGIITIDKAMDIRAKIVELALVKATITEMMKRVAA